LLSATRRHTAKGEVGVMTIIRYGAQRFSGLAADVASLPIDADLLGAIFNSTDTLEFWIFDGNTWNKSAGGGGITGLNPNSTILEYSTDIADYTTPVSATATSPIPTFFDDFNPPAIWDQTGTLNFIANGVINWTGQRQAGNESLVHDLGLISETAWVLRFKWVVDQVNTGVDLRANVVISSLATGDNATLQDAIGIQSKTGSGTDSFVIIQAEGTNLTSPSTQSGSAFTPIAGLVKYIQIRRTSATTIAMETFTDADYTGTPDTTNSLTTSALVNALRYITINGDNVTTGGNTTYNGTIDNVEFYDGVTTVDANVPIYAIDGNTATFWKSDAGVNESITLDMGEIVNAYGLSFFIDKTQTGITETQFQIKSVTTTIPLTELKAYYKYNGLSTPIVNQATAVGSVDGITPSTDADVDMVGGLFNQTGILGESVFFNGTSDSGQAGSSTSQFNFLHDTSMNWTVNYWYKTDGAQTESNAYVIQTADSANSIGFAISHSSTGTLRLDINQGGGTAVITAISTAAFLPVDNQFHFVTITYDQSLGTENCRMYVDNVEDFNSPFNKTGNAPSNSNAARAMRMGNVVTTGWWEGDLDEMSIWNRILSTNERATIFNSGLGLNLGIAEERVLRTLDVTELVDQTTNFIRFNGENTQFIRVEGSSNSSLVMAANELAVQLETDPPLTTLHGQFTIPTIAGTPLNGGDPTSSVIDDPIVNTLGYNNVSEPADPSPNQGVSWVEPIDATNDGLFIKLRVNGTYQTLPIAPSSGGGITGLNPNSTILDYSTTIGDYTSPTAATATSENGGNVATNAIDENTSTFWESNAGINESITIDFSASISVSELKTYWKFDETSGDLINEATAVGSVDSLGIPADGQNTAVTQNQAGIIDLSYLYDGTSSFTDLGTSTTQFDFLHNTTALWSMNFWYKKTVSTPATFQALFSTYSTSGGRVGTAVNFLTDNGINVAIQNGVSSVIAATTAGTIPVDTAFHMLTITMDVSLGSNNMHIYIDNVEIAESPFSKSNTPVDTAHQTSGHLGSSGIGTQNFAGNLDEWSIWERVLTDGERASLFNNGNGLAIEEASINANVFGLAYFISTAELTTMTETQFQIKAGSQVLRTVNKSDLLPDVYNFIRFNGVNTASLTIEGSSGNSLVMVANDLQVQLETDPPLTTLHGQFTINGADEELPLNGGDPTSSVIDSPSVNSMTLVNTVEQNDPVTGAMVMWQETLDANNDVSHSKMKIDGSFKNVRWF